MNKKRLITLTIITILVLNLTGCTGSGNLNDSSSWIDKYIALPLAHFIKFFLDNIGDFGMAIIAVTLITRIAIFPITSGSSTMQLKMQLAQPEMNKLREKYVGKSDPESRRKMAMEQQAIYRKYNINMLGCLAPFLQMPLFFGTYAAIRRFSASFPEYDSLSFFGINLNGVASKGEISAIVIIVIMTILQAGSMYIMQKKPEITKSKKYSNPQTEQMQNTMKYMFMGMIIMLVFLAWESPAALPFYWCCSSTVIILQTLLNRKLSVKKMEKIKSNII